MEKVYIITKNSHDGIYYSKEIIDVFYSEEGAEHHLWYLASQNNQHKISNTSPHDNCRSYSFSGDKFNKYYIEEYIVK